MFQGDNNTVDQIHKKNNSFMKQTIDAFEASDSAEYALYYGDEFSQKYPYLKLGPDAYGCFDPTGGILMADKALKALMVCIFNCILS